MHGLNIYIYIYIYVCVCVCVIAGHHVVELYVYVSHRADSFICRISKTPRAREVLPKFSIMLGFCSRMEDREWMYTGRRGRKER
jgi:hypothetical protein